MWISLAAKFDQNVPSDLGGFAYTCTKIMLIKIPAFASIARNIVNID